MATPEPATNWYGTRRHYSVDLGPDRWTVEGGRRGTPLCSSVGDVRNQDWLNARASQYPHLGRIVIADLPECKKCARILAKQGAAP